MTFEPITFDPEIMGGRACVRQTRVPVSVVLKLIAGGQSKQEILADYPYLEAEDAEDIDPCLGYGAQSADSWAESRSH